MHRASCQGRYESYVLLFAEKVILAAVVPLFILLLANPMKFDGTQQISAIVVLLACGVFVAHTIQKTTQAKSPIAHEIPTRTGSSDHSDSNVNTGDRIFLQRDTTPKYLVGLYRTYTSLQADALAANYVGKWLSVSIKIHDIGPGYHGSFHIYGIADGDVGIGLDFSPNWGARV